MYKVVGKQRSAVRLAVNQGQTVAFFRHILTINSGTLGLSDSRLAGSSDVTISTGPDPLLFDSQNWTLDSKFVAANIGGKQLVAAQGGIFRIDVPKGDRFILTPSQLVAYQGLRPVNVYEHGRLDAIQAWGSWVREGLRAVFTEVTRGAKYVFRKGSQYWSTPAAVADETPSWYTKDPSYAIYWHRVKTSSRGAWGTVRGWFFYATHPKKLQFEGPCAILIRGRI